MLVTIPFPYANMAVSKRRPVLVLTNPDRHGDFVGLAITSVPTEENAVLLDTTSLIQGSVPLKSWVRLDKIYTLDEDSILRELAEVHPDFLRHVVRCVCSVVGLSTSKVVD